MIGGRDENRAQTEFEGIWPALAAGDVSRMSGFKVNARTIFHLGADLISSDAVALYELVKNAFDAGSEDVTIRVRQRVPVDTANPIIDGMAAALEDEDQQDDEDTLEEWREAALESLPGAGHAEFRERLESAEDLTALFTRYRRVNQIVVQDTGDGMTSDELSDVFLRIGTTSRKRQLDRRRQAPAIPGQRPILGEKGVGRLSTMRLGHRLRVETATLEDDDLNVLEIDWSLFSRKPDALLESINFAPESGGPKPRPKGTTIRIFELTSDWTLGKLQQIAREQFARLNDPFSPDTQFPIDLLYNGAAVDIPAFRKRLLEEAHAVLRASFGPEAPDDLAPNGGFSASATPVLSGSIDYRYRRKTLPIHLKGTHLRNAAGGVDDDVLRSLGPFTVDVYWFNRAQLEAVDTIGTITQVKQLVNDWSGGVMVYRDGFRVGAYGSGADDWLDLDQKALASGGYKVNRAQIVGRLAISSVANPRLMDQTNREGLTDSPEKAALVALLKHLLESVFRPFLDRADKDVLAKEPVNLGNVADRVLKQRRDIAATLRLLYQRHPEVKADPELGGRIDEALKEIGEMMRSLVTMGEAYEKGRSQMTVLAGLGLSVAAVAHELRHATSNALEVVEDLRRRRAVADLPTALAPLRAQLRTLLTRLRVLDPLVSSGRQAPVKTTAGEWTRFAVDSARPAFERDMIYLDYEVRRTSGGDDVELRVVPGMIVQVVGNLLDNARYWVGRRMAEDRGHVGRVLVELDVRRREIRVSDNGPGVPEAMRETIFDAFVSTKPVGAGMGLGLFISREIATYMKARLELLETEDTPDGMSTTFALRFGAGA